MNSMERSSTENWFGDHGYEIAPRKEKRVGRWLFAEVQAFCMVEVQAFCMVDDDGCPVSCVEIYDDWEAKGFDWSNDNLNLLVSDMEKE